MAVVGGAGMLMVYQSKTLTFLREGFEVSHLGKVDKMKYVDISEAKEILYRGRGDYEALGYSLTVGPMSKDLSFKVAARGSRTSTLFTKFLKERLGPGVYHDCVETDPDYIRLLWW